MVPIQRKKETTSNNSLVFKRITTFRGMDGTEHDYIVELQATRKRRQGDHMAMAWFSEQFYKSPMKYGY